MACWSGKCGLGSIEIGSFGPMYTLPLDHKSGSPEPQQDFLPDINKPPTRECLSIDVERSITAEDVTQTLASLYRRRGAPTFIRSDNGPEFVARAIKRWLEVCGVETLYIEPGSPWENAYLRRRS